MPVIDQGGLGNRLLEIQGRLCFICEDSINAEIEKTHIDHIVPRAKGGKDDENNYAIVHERCNLSKQDADLRVARCMAKYEKIRTGVPEGEPNRPNLSDFLALYKGGKRPVAIKVDSKAVGLSFPGSTEPTRSLPLYTDTLSGMKYFFAEFPIEYLYHDTRINPRPVGERIRSLVAEFVERRPQLHPSLAWISTTDEAPKICVFDGQHKAVSQILLGVRRLPIRVFVDPDHEVLLEANTRAGTTLRQVAFDKSIQRYLGSQILAERIQAYRDAKGLPSDSLGFSEVDLVKFFKGENRELKRYILDAVRTSVIYDPDNKIREYIEFSGKGAQKPLSYENIEKTFFSLFIHKEPMSVPMSYGNGVGDNPREIERNQIVRLMNVFVEVIYEGKYDFDMGTYKLEEKLRKEVTIPEPHLRAVRLSREEVIYNVLRYVRECVKRYFLMQGGRPFEYEDLFQQRFPNILWDHVRKLLGNVGALPIWLNRDPNISSSVFGGKQNYDYWKHVFDTGQAPAGPKILAKGLTLDDLIT